MYSHGKSPLVQCSQNSSITFRVNGRYVSYALELIAGLDLGPRGGVTYFPNTEIPMTNAHRRHARYHIRRHEDARPDEATAVQMAASNELPTELYNADILPLSPPFTHKTNSVHQADAS